MRTMTEHSITTSLRTQPPRTVPNAEPPFPDWRNIPDDQHRRLVELTKRTPISQGQRLIKYGEEGDILYFLESGRVGFSYTDDTFERHQLHEVGSGGFFGEVGMLANRKRTADAQVLEPGWVYELSREKLPDLLKDCPAVIRALMEGMAWRLSNQSSLIRATVKHIPKPQASKKSPVEVAIDAVVAFMGGKLFLCLNAILFVGWIGWCLLHGIHDATKAEFAALALLISVEALFLSIFVLASQNRQEKDDALIKQRQEQLLDLIDQRTVGLHRKLDGKSERT
jgi:CRP-like cAMP-binding protein